MDTIGGSLLIYGQQSADASFEDNTGQNMGKPSVQITELPSYSLISLHTIYSCVKGF